MSHKTDATLRPFLFAFPHCIPSGRFSRRFAPQNDIMCVARNGIKSVLISCHHCLQTNSYSFPYEVLNVIAKHRFAVLWQSPRREPYHKTHARYFCTCVEKKAHTNKRVSIIACNNVISRVQCATHRPEGLPYKSEVYFLTKS